MALRVVAGIDGLAAATAFFVGLGLTPQGEGPVEACEPRPRGGISVELAERIG